MSIHIVVSVPLGDKGALRELDDSLMSGVEDPVELRPFDGEAVAQVLIALTAAGATVLNTWLRTRAERQSHTVVSIDGMQFTALSADDVVRIMDAIEARVVDADEADTTG